MRVYELPGFKGECVSYRPIIQPYLYLYDDNALTHLTDIHAEFITGILILPPPRTYLPT